MYEKRHARMEVSLDRDDVLLDLTLDHTALNEAFSQRTASIAARRNSWAQERPTLSKHRQKASWTFSAVRDSTPLRTCPV